LVVQLAAASHERRIGARFVRNGEQSTEQTAPGRAVA